MNDHDLEQQLRGLPAPELPSAWRAEILARARREARPVAAPVWPAVVLWLRLAFARNPITSSALAMLWAVILFFKATTPVDPAAENVLLVKIDPARPIYFVSLAEQIRLADLWQDSPNQQPPIP
jgi:hypothetical protein